MNTRMIELPDGWHLETVDQSPIGQSPDLWILLWDAQDQSRVAFRVETDKVVISDRAWELWLEDLKSRKIEVYRRELWELDQNWQIERRRRLEDARRDLENVERRAHEAMKRGG